jgi:EAL domain-containing protein (putative c-di-GMP-specific phosphodiesterase class I)
MILGESFQTAAKGRAKERHAFVVDDEAHMRTLVSNLLVSSGFTSHQFATVADVETALTKWAPGLIVLDLSLADSDAIEVIRNLSAARFGGQVLLISSHDAATLEQVRAIGQARGLSMLPVLQKPFRTEELRAAILLASETPPEASAELSLEAALRNNWLELWYQPKIDLKTRLYCGAEALIRLVHPVHGVTLPGIFLPEPGSPLYVPLTDFIVRRALTDWSTFAQHRMTNRLAINVPASVLQRPDFVANVRSHLPKRPDFPGLIVEITEDEAISDPDLANEIAVQLKLYNVHVSIDDFGSGYSSMARLKELPFSEIKLDRSFVQGCASDDTKRRMCEAVADLARRSTSSRSPKASKTTTICRC